MTDLRAVLAARAPGVLAWLRARADALRFHPREAAALAVLGALVLSGAGIAYVRARPAAAAPIAPVGTPAASPDARAGEIFVHVVGAVRRPGVYAFSEGARVIDAVKAAGGLARGADAFAVNLARALVDGEQIVVPRRGEAPPAASMGRGGAGGVATVNLNRASAADLEGLPGIGPVLAERIVVYREQHGPFRAVRDLMKVAGIGPKKFGSIEPYVTV